MDITATLTSKGQLTLPKAARDALGLKTGQQLRVAVSKAGQIMLTPVKLDPLALCGLLPKPHRAYTVREMDEAVQKHVARTNAPTRFAGTIRKGRK